MPFPGDFDTDFAGVSARILAALTESGLITDAHAGSVARTLVEAFSREVATCYALLDRAHDAGFLDTAQGKALDNVVSVLGLRRAPAGRLKGRVEFARVAPAPEDISIPAGLRVTGPEQQSGRPLPVLQTIEDVVIGRGETRVAARVQEVAGLESDQWTAIPPGALSIMPRPVLGVETVKNPDPITRDGQEEDDQHLRARAQAALREAQRGTQEAIEAAVREQGVEHVEVIEPPDEPPGSVVVLVGDPEFERQPARIRAVTTAVRAAKAAGIRASLKFMRSVYFQPTFDVEPEDPEMDDAGFQRLSAELRDAVSQFIASAGAGVAISRRKLDAVVLGHPGVRDGTLFESETRTFTLNYPEQGDGEPELAVDTRERGLPNGDWHISALERAILDRDRWPVRIDRRQVRIARLGITVTIGESDLPAATIRDAIRATVNGYVARLLPDRDTGHRTLSFSGLTQELQRKTLVTAVRSMEVVHLWSGAAESLPPNADVLLVPGERVTVDRIDSVEVSS